MSNSYHSVVLCSFNQYLCLFLRKRKKHKKDKDKDKPEKKRKVDTDAESHGGWWKATKAEEITGSVAIEFTTNSYIRALDNGLFTLGPPHTIGEGPAPEEILTAILINESKVAFKSGYGKYLKIEKDNTITGRSDAVAAMEQFEPVFENGKTAILAANGCFLSIDPEDDALVALRKQVGAEEILTIRSCNVRVLEEVDDVPVEEKEDDLGQVEINYVKKFQKFQDKKMRVCAEDKEELKKAKAEGLLHEALLDRRSKMKADRYCK